MKHRLRKLLARALADLENHGTLPSGHDAAAIHVERARRKGHGDFASNVALTLADKASLPPRKLAQAIVERLPASDFVDQVEIAGPGFINFFLSRAAFETVVPDVLEAGDAFGRSDIGAGQKVQVEFVSANPTGPLHVGHGRGAAYGAAVAELLQAVGFEVQREYYVNDAGRQMNILATSIWLRYLELSGEEVPFPASGYRGDYIYDIAHQLYAQHGKQLRRSANKVVCDLPPDISEDGDAETHIDALISRAKTLLGEAQYLQVYNHGLETILANIRKDLEQFGVHHDVWFSERSVTQSDAMNDAIERLRASGHVYHKDAALWFRSTDYQDEKDRVLIKNDGQHTYFASDFAYHLNKLGRGFDRLIDIWGADHHGHVPRMKAAFSAIDEDPAKLDILLVQFAVLYRDGKKLQMSTRSGEFVTLHELCNEIGKDAARFFYVMRKCEQHMDFDLDLAKSQTAENPVYYIQYAHARICSVFRQMQEKKLTHNRDNGNAHLNLLTESHEQDLLVALSRYPEAVESAATALEPHQIAHYLRGLANGFHTYYNAHTFLVDSAHLRDARLNLIAATRQVLSNGLMLIGVSAPEKM